MFITSTDIFPRLVVGVGTLSLEEFKRYIDQGYQVRFKQVGGKTYVAVRKDKVERGAGPLDSYDPEMQAFIRCIASKVEWGKCLEEAGLEASDTGEQESVGEQPVEQWDGGTQTSQQPRSEPNVVEGDRVVVEREVELETIWNVRRIALDPRVYILYAYAQKYLGYQGSLGEFLSDCAILFFKERGVEVILKLPEGGAG